MPRKAAIFLAFAVTLLAAGSAASQAGDLAVTEGDPLRLRPDSQRALLFFLNPGKSKLDLFLDRTPLGRLKASYLAVQAEPGPRVIWGAAKPKRFDLEAGKVYVLTFVEEWHLAKTEDPARPVARYGLRFTAPAPEDLADLRKRLAAGDDPWAVTVAGGQLPAVVRYAILRGGRFGLLEPGKEEGVLMIERTALTYQRGQDTVQIPWAEILETDGPETRYRLGMVPWPKNEEPVLRVRLARGETSGDVWFEVRREDMRRARAALSTAVLAGGRGAALPGEEVPSGPVSSIEHTARLADALEAKVETAREPAWGRSASAGDEERLAGLTDMLLDLLSYFEVRPEEALATLRGPAGITLPVGPVAITYKPTLGMLARARNGLLPAPLPGREAAVLAGDPALPQVAAALRDLESHLASHPDDPQTLLLAARLGRIAELGRPLPAEAALVDWLRLEAAARARAQRLQALLARALELSPGDAAVHLAAARLASLPLLAAGVDGIALRPLDDPGQVLHFARRARELAPADPAALALSVRVLVAAGKPDEALAALRKAGSEDQPMGRLLSDLAAIPIPEGAVPLPAESERLTPLLAAAGWFDVHRELRVRSFAVPGPAGDVLGFYRRAWPGSAFFDLGKEELGQTIGHLRGQHFRRTAQGTLQPTGSRANIAQNRGIAIFLLELSAVPPEAAKLMPAAQALPKERSRFCLLTVATLGTFQPTLANNSEQNRQKPDGSLLSIHDDSPHQ